jgi:translation initiation factor IF-1
MAAITGGKKGKRAKKPGASSAGGKGGGLVTKDDYLKEEESGIFSYARVIAIKGGSNVHVFCAHDNREHQVTIRGKHRGKYGGCRVVADGIVLVQMRGFQNNDVGDIVEIYSHEEATSLKGIHGEVGDLMAKKAARKDGSGADDDAEGEIDFATL